jgi:FMNH2-dependent dimethyl sulfone monooxygenase
MTEQVSRSAEPTFFSGNTFKLGVFCLNVSGGMMMSGAAKQNLDWNENVSVAKFADEAGWDFLLPLGRWRGHGGKYKANAEQYDPFSWAAAIAAVTSRIQVFSTCHVPIFHPMLTAKMSATIDNISNGRFGLNIVSGWNAAEFGMFGIEQLPHDDRYLASEEWLDVIEGLWSTKGELDHEGRFYNIKRGYLEPKPIQERPVIVSAGTSPVGVDFALNRADYLFIGGDSWELLEGTMQTAHKRAAELGRQLNALTFATVVVRDTEEEAKRYFEWYVDELGDKEAAQALVDRIISGGAQSLPPEAVAQQVRAFVSGWGAMPIVGTPEQVAGRLDDMHKLGLQGVTMGWLDYTEGVEQFDAQVVPLLKEAGLRL